MPVSVSFWFDPATDARVRAVWRELAEAGISSYMHECGFRPHITLVAFEDSDPASLLQVLRDRAGAVRALPLELYFLGQFLSPVETIFLAPIVTAPMLSLRAAIVEVLAHAGRSPAGSQYDADRWVPHATLGTEMSAAQLSAAFEVCRKMPLPLTARVDRLGLVDYATVVEIGEIPLL